MEIDLAKRYQTMITLWAAMLMSVFLYFVTTLLAAPEINDEAARSNRTLVFALGAFGFSLVVASFVVKKKFLERSVEQQDISLVQKGMVLALALCEPSALIALLERFAIGNRDYYVMFLLAAAGIVLHFPRRVHLEAATYRNRAQLS